MPIISTVEGNLITLAQNGRYTEIAHGANCWLTFGAGIAPQIGKAFPEALRADRSTRRGDRSKLGKVSVGTHTLTGGGAILQVINMYTQFGTSGYRKGVPDIDYRALADAFIEVNRVIRRKKLAGKYKTKQLLGIPRLGCGLAGGSWGAVSTIINLVTPDVDIELVNFVPLQKTLTTTI